RVRFAAAGYLPDRAVRITGRNILVGNWEGPCEVDALHMLWGLGPERGNKEQSKHQYPDEIPHQHQRPLVICGCYKLPVELSFQIPIAVNSKCKYIILNAAARE